MSGDKSREERARRVYDAQQQRTQQAAAREAIRLAQEDARRKAEFIREKLPIFTTATEEALRRLERHNFPGMHPVRYSVYETRKFLFVDNSGYQPREKLGGWKVYGGVPHMSSYGASGSDFYLMVDGTYLEHHQQNASGFDSNDGSSGWRDISVEQLVEAVYAGGEATMGSSILRSLAGLGTDEGQTQ